MHGHVLAQLGDEFFILALNAHASFKLILQLAQFVLNTRYFMILLSVEDLEVLSLFAYS